jgi:glucokinase
MSLQPSQPAATPDAAVSPGTRIGVALSGNHIQLGVLTADGQLRHLQRENYAVASENPANGPALAQQLRTLLQQTLSTNPGISAVGIAFPGLIQQPTQHILQLEHAPGLVGYPLQTELQTALQLPVHFENCATAAAYAEMNAGVARGLQDWLYLHIGENVSAGLILGGQLQRGKSGLAGAIGEMAIDPEHTGEFVSLESMVSTNSITRRTRRRLERDSTSSLSRLRIMGGFTYDDIIAAADNGDDLARLMLQRTGKFIGMAIAEIINLLDLSLVAIGGAPAARRFLVPSITEETQQRASELLYANCQIVAAGLGEEACVIGAALLA